MGNEFALDMNLRSGTLENIERTNEDSSMKGLLYALAASLVVCSFVPLAHAQIDQQNNELGFSAAITKPPGDNPGSIHGMFHYGRMITAGWQLGGDLMVAGDTDFKQNMMYLMPSARYYIGASNPKMSPYAGLMIGIFFLNGERQDDIVWDPHAGVKYFVSEETAIFAQLDYLAMQGEWGDGIYRGSVGLSVFY